MIFAEKLNRVVGITTGSVGMALNINVWCTCIRGVDSLVDIVKVVLPDTIDVADNVTNEVDIAVGISYWLVSFDIVVLYVVSFWFVIVESQAVDLSSNTAEVEDLHEIAPPNSHCLLDKLEVVGVRIDDLDAGELCKVSDTVGGTWNVGLDNVVVVVGFQQKGVDLLSALSHTDSLLFDVGAVRNWLVLASPNACCFLDKLEVVGVKIDNLDAGELCKVCDAVDTWNVGLDNVVVVVGFQQKGVDLLSALSDTDALLFDVGKVRNWLVLASANACCLLDKLEVVGVKIDDLDVGELCKVCDAVGGTWNVGLDNVVIVVGFQQKSVDLLSALSHTDSLLFDVGAVRNWLVLASPNAYCLLDKLEVVGVKIDDLDVGELCKVSDAVGGTWNVGLDNVVVVGFQEKAVDLLSALSHIDSLLFDVGEVRHWLVLASPNAYCLLDKLRVFGAKIDDLGIASSTCAQRSWIHAFWHVPEAGSGVCTVFAHLLSDNVRASKALEKNEVAKRGADTVLEVLIAWNSGVESFFRFSEFCFTSVFTSLPSFLWSLILFFEIRETPFSDIFALFVLFPPSSVSHIKLFLDIVASVFSWPALSISNLTFAIFAAIDLFDVVFGNDDWILVAIWSVELAISQYGQKQQK